MYKSLRYFLLALMPAAALMSCRKFVDIAPPRDQLSDEAVFTADGTALSAMAGAYAQIMRNHLSLGNAGLSVYTGLSADEIYHTSPNEDYDALLINAITSNQVGMLNDLWQSSYQLIYHCTAILDGVERSSSLSTAVRDQLRGEAYFLRAYLYFHLTNLFGPVPLPLSKEYRSNALLPRSSVDSVYKQVERDLNEAIALLPPQINSRKTRPGRWAAKALLARVYLYQEKWPLASAIATEVIQQGGFAMVPLTQVFGPSSRETIWQLVSAIPAVNTSQGLLFVPVNASLVPGFSLTDDLWTSFSPADQRRAQWLQTLTMNGTTYVYPFKYKLFSSTQGIEHNIVFRLTELLLIRSEARVHEQELTAALDDLNTVHLRAGLPVLSLTQPDALLEAIYQERRWELFTEGGHRWFDLKRSARADAVLSALKGNHWQPTDALYPIPFRDLQTNVYLNQNPGY